MSDNKWADQNTAIIEEFRANDGVVGGYSTGVPIALVHHKGARSGIDRIAPLASQKVDNGWAVFASKGGADDNPAWYYNLLANPDTTVEVGTETVAGLPVAALADDGLSERYTQYADVVAVTPLYRTVTVSVPRESCYEEIQRIRYEPEPRRPRGTAARTVAGGVIGAGREIEDDSLAEAMKQTGLGTPATRAEIIEKLIRTEYVQRERKQLRATEKGQAPIGLVAEPLRSPELTAEWEQQLKEVEEGRHQAAQFYRDIVDFIRELIPQVAQGPALSPEQVAAARARQPGRKGKGRKGGGAKPAGLGRCRLCKAGEIVETAKAYGCSRYREGCRLTIWKTVAGRKLTKQQVGQLLREGRTERIEGFTSKAGKPFAARLKLGEGFKVEFDFADGPRQVDLSGSAAAPGRAGGTTASPAAAPMVPRDSVLGA